MNKHILHSDNTSLTYYLKGSSPQILFVSGLHGDESGVIPVLHKTITKYMNILPSFLYIPIASPSATRLGTRQNIDGVDLNRSFCEETSTNEAQVLMKLLKNYHFSLAFSFHEDCEWQRVYGPYFYDTDILDSKYLGLFKTALQKLKLKPFTGIDDLEDKNLGNMIIDGYLSHDKGTSGSLDTWILNNKTAQRFFDIEIPTKFTPIIKKKVVDAFFCCVILKLIVSGHKKI